MPKKNCCHLSFTAQAKVGRIVDPHHVAIAHKVKALKYIVDVTVKCVDCGQSLLFCGMPIGIRSDLTATMSFDRVEARLNAVMAD